MDRFFPLALREAKVQEVINMKKGHICVREYFLKFTKLFKYVPFILADLRARMSKFIFGLLYLVSKECKIALLMKEMDISRLMIYAEIIEEKKLRECARESMMDGMDGEGFSPQRSGGHVKFQGGQIHSFSLIQQGQGG